MTLAPLDLPAVLDLAASLGLTVGRGGFGPCPVCGADRRSTHDRRPPLKVYKGGGWGCLAGCHLGDGKSSTGGDALALLAFVRCGERPAKGDPRWRGLLAELRGADPVPVSRATATSTAARPVADLGPDPAEVAALWARCSPLTALDDLDPALRWLRCHRSLCVENLAAVDLVRAMPFDGPLPAWVPSLGIARATWRAVYRLAVPVYDAAGELRSLRWRAVDRYATRSGPNLWGPPPGCVLEERAGKTVLSAPRWGPRDTGASIRGEQVTLSSPPRAVPAHPVEGPGELRDLPKSLAARGCGSAAGLVLADPMGLALLRGRLDDEGVRWSGRVVIVEGEPDLWSYATNRPNVVRTGETFAAFGVEAGSWTTAHAARIPDGAEVLIATDDDEAGDRYAATIIPTLQPRCKLKRPRRNHVEKP